MAAPIEIRLSPSGPFLKDTDSGQPLQGGDGTPGLIWRGQGTGTSATGCDPSGDVIPGLDGLAWVLPPGYKYDVRCDIQMFSCGATDQIDTHVQYSEDGGLTWLPAMPASVCRTVSLTYTTATYAALASHQEVRWDRTGAAVQVDTMRVWLVGPATSNYIPAGCVLRVFQYID